MNRDFKGVWIPREIWLRTDLNALEKVIFTEIDSLDNDNHCTAGNEYFANFCQCSESKVTKAIRKLIDLGLIEILEFDGRHRKIKVIKTTRQHSKKYEADPEILRPNNISSNTNKLFTSKDVNNIDWFIECYHDICISLPKVRAITDKRKKAIVKITKKYSKVDILTAFQNVQKSDFLTGKNDRGWKADIDFILREDKFVAILEGKYGTTKRTHIIGETENMSSDQYTQDELRELENLNNERRRNGERTQF